jgi:hypothetical protein
MNRQFLPQGTSSSANVKVTVQPQKLLETAPVASQQSTKMGYTQKSNFMSTDKLSSSKPQTPGNAFIETQQTSTKTDGFGTTNFGITSTGNLRPQTVQQP